MSFVEGIRVDIYFLGIIILKMLGKMRVEEGDNSNMTSLLQIQDISIFYQNESLSPEMISFLDICFHEPHITLSEIMLHELIVGIVTKSESIKTFPESPNNTLTFNDTSSKKSGTTNTSKVLKRYLTSGTHEGSSSEYYSEVTSQMMNSSVDTFRRKQKIQSVLYEDSSFILKKLIYQGKRKTQLGAPNQKGSGKSLSKFVSSRSVMIDTSSQSSSSPGSFARVLDRTNDHNRIMILDDKLSKKADPIFEEVLEEDEYGSKPC